MGSKRVSISKGAVRNSVTQIFKITTLKLFFQTHLPWSAFAEKAAGAIKIPLCPAASFPSNRLKSAYCKEPCWTFVGKLKKPTSELFFSFGLILQEQCSKRAVICGITLIAKYIFICCSCFVLKTGNRQWIFFCDYSPVLRLPSVLCLASVSSREVKWVERLCFLPERPDFNLSCQQTLAQLKCPGAKHWTPVCCTIAEFDPRPFRSCAKRISVLGSIKYHIYRIT